MKKWCSAYWLYVLYALGFGVAILTICNWANWTIAQRCIAMNGLILPFHVMEEWRIPAGFHYMYNTMMKSELPDRYPMNMQTDMITNLCGEILFVILIFLTDVKGIALAIMVFDFLEVVVHTFGGVFMYRRLKNKGKRTIYAPGTLTAWLGQGTVGLVLLQWTFTTSLEGRDFAIMVFVLVIMLVGLIVIPETLLKRKDTPYIFPTNGYFERFCK